MKSLLQRYATPFVTGLFLVSLVSGIALFFHLGTSWFHGMHEWLSMVLILPFLLHVWRNWRAFTNYFRHVPMMVALAVSLLAALYYVLPSDEQARGGPPQFAFASQILRNVPTQVAPLLGETPDALVQRLHDSGFAAASADLPLSEIATQSGKSEAQLIQAVMNRTQ